MLLACNTLRRPHLQQGLDGCNDGQVEGNHTEEDDPAQHRSQLPLPKPPPAIPAFLIS